MAVVGPVRTLLVAHLQAGWNRSRKELGKTGRTAYVITLTMLGLFAAMPMVGGSLVGGYFLGRGLPDPILIRILGGILAFLALLGGIVGGLFSGNRTLGWESTRIFPLRLRSLFTAELIAGMGDLLPLVMAIISACLLLGVGVAKPVLLMLLPLPWLGTLLAVLCIRYLVGSLSARLTKHLRLALAVLAFFLWITTTLLPTTTRRITEKGRSPSAISLQVKQGLKHLVKVVDHLPSTQSVRGLGDALQGRWGLALSRQIYPMAMLALLLLAAASTLKHDSNPQASDPVKKGSAEKLWSFSTPMLGVARLQWRAITSSHLGRFQLLIPLMVLVLIKGPFASIKGATIWTLPMAFAYLSMSGIQIQLNQFGLDGPGIKALLLLPIRSRDLLVGKTLGLLGFLGIQVALLLILLSLVGKLGPLQALAGVCFSGCLFLLQVSLGHWTSAWLPRPMPRDSLKNNNMAQPVIWLGMAGMLVGMLIFGGIFLLTNWLAPALLLPVMALLLGMLFLIYKHQVLPAAARYLDGRKEVLVQSLG